MACIAKKSKKVRLMDMQPDQCIQYLFLRFIMYLRGEKMVTDKYGFTYDEGTEYLGDGSFKPSERDIAEVFKYLDGLWKRYVRSKYKKETWEKYYGLFTQAVSEEWKASKVEVEEESPS